MMPVPSFADRGDQIVTDLIRNIDASNFSTQCVP